MRDSIKRPRILRGSDDTTPNDALDDPGRGLRPETDHAFLGQIRPEKQGAHTSDDGQTSEMSAREEIEEIKKENLTGRELRRARRMAQQHNIRATSDLDAVRILRKKGLNPFGGRTVLDEAAASEQPQEFSKLPATVRRSEVTDAIQIDELGREREILRIRADLVIRRRRRLMLMFVKLAFFIGIPTLFAGLYFYKYATPMYATYTQFVIQTSESQAPGASGLGGLGASLLTTTQDSIVVQGYLTSRDAMLRLNAEAGFKEIFQADNVDSLQKLKRGASNEATYKIYKKHVQLGYDPTEGIIKMEVSAPSPAESLLISDLLIGYAEQQVDDLTKRKRTDQMQGAFDAYQEAEDKYNAAQDRVLELQQKRGVLSAEGEISATMGQITSLDNEILIRRLDLAEILDNPRPNKTKVTVLERSIDRRKLEVAKLRQEMINGEDGNASIAKISGELLAAQSELQVRQSLLGLALQQQETARVDATRQTRYLSMGVAPVAPDAAAYPKAFENTLLAFIIFAGIYLVASLTASILREQVST